MEHATVQFNLGLALAEAPHGNREDNLAAAIKAYAEALRVFHGLSFATERARVLTALGAAERDLGRSVQARDRFSEAAGLLDPDQAPAEYGSALNDLGLVEVDLGRAEAAVEAYELALDAFDAERYPRQRAAALHNLGLARAQAATPAALEAAVADYRAALELVTPTGAPYIYAATQHSLGTAMLDLPDDRQSRLTEAVRAFQAALTVFTRVQYPFQHAVTKNNLAVAFEELTSDDPTSLRRALVHVEDALALLDPRLHGEQWREAKANLDRIEQRLHEAGHDEGRGMHFARLLGATSRTERTELLRYRIRAYLSLPPTHRDSALSAMDRDVTALDAEAVSAVTVTWMHVLMEQPHEGLMAALEMRHAANEALGGETRRAAISAMEDALGDLEIIQRMRIRDLLTAMGHERPDPP